LTHVHLALGASKKNKPIVIMEHGSRNVFVGSGARSFVKIQVDTRTI